ncbi:MAG: zinc metallopeptidase [Puniceicoccales bacterium]|jgi:hypothetical protein|nr:zinc metallopeptidase [Puniceicoccales bacterium]
MILWDYQIGGSLRRTLVIDAVKLLRMNGDNKKITNKNMLERIYSNPLAVEIFKRKGVELAGYPGFFCRVYNFFRGIGLGIICLLMSLLSFFTGIYASYKLTKIQYDLANIDIPRAKDGDGDKTVYDIMRHENLKADRTTESPVSIIIGKTDGLSSCFYDPIHNTVSIPPCIGNMVAKKGDILCKTADGKDFGAATALAIAFHEMGHAEQRKFLLFISFAVPVAGIAILILYGLTLAFATSTISIAITIALAVTTILLVLTRPIVQFFYERDASVRSIASLMANGHIKTEEEATEAVYALQLAASTYLINTVKSVLEELVCVFTRQRKDGNTQALQSAYG